MILKGERPNYDDIKINLNSPQDLIDTNFSAGNSFCKAVLCLLAYHEPKDFQDNGRVILDNSWLKMANSKNYHHFFPKAYLKNKRIPNSNSIVNITFVSDHLNKKKIGSKAPSVYISNFQDENPEIDKSLHSHLIGLAGFGIESDDYSIFLQGRAELIFRELISRVELSRVEPANEEIEELVLGGENDLVEFKASLRFDLRNNNVNKKLEFLIAKSIAAFLNSEGGSLFIGVDDLKNSLGLSHDISTLKTKNIDGFELQLIEVIKQSISGMNLARISKLHFLSMKIK